MHSLVQHEFHACEAQRHATTRLVGGGIAALVARVALQRRKVQQRRAADQALQLGRAEQVDGRPAAQHHEPPRKRLKLRGTARSGLSCDTRQTPVIHINPAQKPQSARRTIHSGLRRNMGLRRNSGGTTIKRVDPRVDASKRATGHELHSDATPDELQPGGHWDMKGSVRPQAGYAGFAGH